MERIKKFVHVDISWFIRMAWSNLEFSLLLVPFILLVLGSLEYVYLFGIKMFQNALVCGVNSDCLFMLIFLGERSLLSLFMAIFKNSKDHISFTVGLKGFFERHLFAFKDSKDYCLFILFFDGLV
jgi:hypothetical protein